MYLELWGGGGGVMVNRYRHGLLPPRRIKLRVNVIYAQGLVTSHIISCHFPIVGG